MKTMVMNVGWPGTFDAGQIDQFPAGNSGVITKATRSNTPSYGTFLIWSRKPSQPVRVIRGSVIQEI